MANEEHLKILEQGVEVWNKWMAEHTSIKPDLQSVDLRDLKLADALFIRADLYGVDLRGANLQGISLANCNLNSADLSYADLDHAFLVGTTLRVANLAKANLNNANLSGAEFFQTNVDGTDFNNAIMSSTIVAASDLSPVVGLDSVRHAGPSTIGTDTLYLSKGKIPEKFLRGCGVPDDIIALALSLSLRPTQFNSCFISYSSKDQEFVERLYKNLQTAGVRCWYAPEDLVIGDKFRTRIEESIHTYDKLLLVLSENSIQSTWVQDEVEAALAREQREKSLVLFPIRLDNAAMETSEAWVASLRRIRHMGDFSNWKNEDNYQKSFDRLLRDLKARPKTTPAP